MHSWATAQSSISRNWFWVEFPFPLNMGIDATAVVSSHYFPASMIFDTSHEFKGALIGQVLQRWGGTWFQDVLSSWCKSSSSFRCPVKAPSCITFHAILTALESGCIHKPANVQRGMCVTSAHSPCEWILVPLSSCMSLRCIWTDRC